MTTMLLYLCVICMILGFVWLLYVTWQVNWRWTLASLLLAGLPIPAFCVIHWRRARRPLALVALSPLIGIGVIIATGDLVVDKHPDEPAERTWTQRAFGCSGARLWQELLAADDRPIEYILGELPPVDTTASGLAMSRTAAKLSALAYLPPTSVRQQAIQWNVPADQTRTISAGSQFALLFAMNDLVFVAFRGTDDPKDWVSDARFTPTASPWGDVHKGFEDALDQLWPAVSRSIADLRNGNRKVVFTGHSLGGAMAVLAATRFKQENAESAETITFGQPPAGYENFAESFTRDFTAPLRRYVNHVDAVVRVATPITALQLTHVGAVRYFDTAGRLHRGGPDFMQSLRDAVCAPSFEAGANFGAHGVRRYVMLLDRAESPQDQ